MKQYGEIEAKSLTTLIICRFMCERGEGAENVSLLEQAEMICKEAGEKANPQRKSLWGCWISIAATVGDTKQFLLHSERRLELAEAKLRDSGVESSYLAVAYNDMGQAYSMNHLPDKAISYLERSRDIRLGLPGFRKDWLFSPFYHLALAHTCLGNHDKAFEIIQQAINDRIEVLGPNDRDSVR